MSEIYNDLEYQKNIGKNMLMYVCPRCHKDHGPVAICGISAEYCPMCDEEMKNMSINLEYIKKKLEEANKYTMFTSEEHSLTNEEVAKLNELPENIKKLIKRYNQDEYKAGYDTGYYEGGYYTRAAVEGEII